MLIRGWREHDQQVNRLAIASHRRPRPGNSAPGPLRERVVGEADGRGAEGAGHDGADRPRLPRHRRFFGDSPLRLPAAATPDQVRGRLLSLSGRGFAPLESPAPTCLPPPHDPPRPRRPLPPRRLARGPVPPRHLRPDDGDVARAPAALAPQRHRRRPVRGLVHGGRRLSRPRPHLQVGRDDPGRAPHRPPPRPHPPRLRDRLAGRWASASSASSPGTRSASCAIPGASTTWPRACCRSPCGSPSSATSTGLVILAIAFLDELVHVARAAARRATRSRRRKAPRRSSSAPPRARSRRWTSSASRRSCSRPCSCCSPAASGSPSRCSACGFVAMQFVGGGISAGSVLARRSGATRPPSSSPPCRCSSGWARSCSAPGSRRRCSAASRPGSTGSPGG